MICQGVDTFLAEAFGGGGWGPIPIPSGEGVEDLVGSGSACLLVTEEDSMDQDPTIIMDPMESPPIHIKNSKI